MDHSDAGAVPDRIIDASERRQKRDRERTWLPGSHLTRFAMNVVICIGLLNDCDFTQGVEWLQQRRDCRWHKVKQNMTSATLLKEAQDVFLAMSDAQIASFEDPAITGWSNQVYKVAHRFVRDHDLALHVHKVNIQKGLPVPSSVLPELANESLSKRDLTFTAVQEVLPNTATAVRSWSYRWRKRMSATMGRFGERPDLTPAEILAKVM
jgi:hypothetical protein